MYHSRKKRLSCFLAKCGSIFENGTMWKARSHAANQGYSHLSGIEMMSSATKWRQSPFRSPEPPASGSMPCSSSQRLLADELVVLADPGQEVGPEFSRLAAAGREHLVEVTERVDPAGGVGV